jgi:hypothetical protein
VAQVEIVSEREGRGGWVFAARVLDDAGTLRDHEVHLSWADYNLWSGSGADEPAAVAAAAVLFLCANLAPEKLTGRFDAATARRLFPGADQQIPSLIHDHR